MQNSKIDFIDFLKCFSTSLFSPYPFMRFGKTARLINKMQASLNKLHSKALRLLAKYGESLDYLKGQMAFLLQKYTFVQLTRKLGFKLAYQNKKEGEKPEGADAKEFRRLVVETVQFCRRSTGVSDHTVVAAVAKALRVRVSLVTYWLRDKQ